MENIRQEGDSKKGRFRIFSEDQFAGELLYTQPNEHSLVLEHTEVVHGFEGKGFAKKLVQAAVDYARKDNRKIKAHCEYAHTVLSRDTSVQDIFIK